jgi:AmiR/NasT family two-component response regulator
MNLFGVEPGALGADELRIAQALADVATIGILQERTIHRQETVAEQLQAALNSRVVIEQAKGVLAERGRLDMASTFEVLRGYARSTNQRLSDVARGVVDGTIGAAALGVLPGDGGRGRVRTRPD